MLKESSLLPFPQLLVLVTKVAQYVCFSTLLYRLIVQAVILFSQSTIASESSYSSLLPTPDPIIPCKTGRTLYIRLIAEYEKQIVSQLPCG